MITQDIARFEFDSQELRTATVDGETLFCGKDVATILGYERPSNAINAHCKGALKRCPLETLGGTQEFTFITEPDLYRLITHSKLPTAEISGTLGGNGKARIDCDGREDKETVIGCGARVGFASFCGERREARGGSGCVRSGDSSSGNRGCVGYASQLCLHDYQGILEKTCTYLCAFVRVVLAHKTVQRVSNKNRVNHSPQAIHAAPKNRALAIIADALPTYLKEVVA